MTYLRLGFWATSTGSEGLPSHPLDYASESAPDIPVPLHAIWTDHLSIRLVLVLAMLIYLDDWNSCSPHDATARHYHTWLSLLTELLGFLINHTISDPFPSQIFQFIGFPLDLVIGFSCPADHRVETSMSLASRFLGQ